VVFGSSAPVEGDEAYARSVKVGELLAKKGIAIINGGYAGTMEGTARGQSENGGRTVGMLIPGIFIDRSAQGNKFLTESVDCENLVHRLDHLTKGQTCFLILPGTVGTLTELCIVWNQGTLAIMNDRPPPAIIAWKSPWEEHIQHTAKLLNLPQNHVDFIRFVDTPEEAAERVAEVLLKK